MYKSLPKFYSSDEQMDRHSPVTHAIPQAGNTAIGLGLKGHINNHKGESGFKLLGKGSDSFGMRLALIQAAERSIDLQYYSIHDDTTSNLLLEALVKAVRRRVRVRFLLDDINFSEVSETFCVLNGFKNIDIRVFNPFINSKHGFINGITRMLTRIDSINRRMHNKSLIVDNQMAIIGGRNLGDEYFEQHTDVTFRDIDVLTAGPVTSEISASFDEYWNSKHSVLLRKLRHEETNVEKVQDIRRHLREHWEKIFSSEKGRKLLDYKLSDYLQHGSSNLIWANAKLIADKPEKIDGQGAENASTPINALRNLLENAKEEFIAVSPYLVPGKKGMEWLENLSVRGVKVKLLTNSLGSTDVVAVHTGYRRYRQKMLDLGIELYEMKPIGGKRPRQRLIGKKAPARASLHAKVYVIDKRYVMVGSFNLDPRSYDLNTELGIIIDSPALAEQVIQMFSDVTRPDTSYQVFSSNGLRWRASDKGINIEYRNEPDSGIGRRIEAAIFSIFPLEDQL